MKIRLEMLGIAALGSLLVGLFFYMPGNMPPSVLCIAFGIAVGMLAFGVMLLVPSRGSK